VFFPLIAVQELCLRLETLPTRFDHAMVVLAEIQDPVRQGFESSVGSSHDHFFSVSQMAQGDSSEFAAPSSGGGDQHDWGAP